MAELPAVIASKGDHDAVIGAPAGLREVDREGPFAAAHFFAQTAIGGDATTDDEGFGANAVGCLAGAVEEFRNDGVLEAGKHVEGRRVGGGVETTLGAAGLHPAEHGRLETAEAEVAQVALEFGRGELDRARVAQGGQSIDNRAARITEAKEFGHLVVGLAGGVIARLAFEAVLAFAEAFEEMGVAATGNEREGRVFDIDAEQSGADVAFEMVNTDERYTFGVGERLGVGEADEKAADKTGALGDRDGGEVFEAGVRLFEGFADDRDDGADVLAAGEFGHNTAIALVNFQLGRYARGKDLRAIFDDCCGGFIARRFDAKNSQTYSLTCAPTH